MSIGTAIRKARIAKGYSQQFVADTMGISQSKFNRIENSQTDISVQELISLRNTLQIDIIDLLRQINEHDSTTLGDNHNSIHDLSPLLTELRMLRKEVQEMKRKIINTNRAS